MIKRIKRKLKELLGLGSKPSFLIIGAQKSGTTSLYDYLVNSSSKIKSARSKELYYFTENHHHGERYYESNFPVLRKGEITGEATPDYLFYMQCPKKVYDYNKNMKIIVILRDPVERAYSQYSHQNYTWKTRAADPLRFSDAIRSEGNRFHYDGLTKYYYEYKYYSYKARGMYYQQLSRWLEYFDLENIHIVFTKDLSENPKKVVESILQFLEVPADADKVNFAVKNRSPSSAISDEDSDYLRGCFKEDSRLLFELLNIEPKW